MSLSEFNALLELVAKAITGRELDDALAEHLNATFPANQETFRRMSELCAIGEAENWLMPHETGGIKFGRVIKPGGHTGNLSVDVVRMRDIKGPHHIHTKGEIGAIMPISGAPKFDGMTAGWYVYPPGSDHYPTVAGGDAYVLYLLPEGAIEFTGR